MRRQQPHHKLANQLEEPWSACLAALGLHSQDLQALALQFMFRQHGDGFVVSSWHLWHVYTSSIHRQLLPAAGMSWNCSIASCMQAAMDQTSQ